MVGVGCGTCCEGGVRDDWEVFFSRLCDVAVREAGIYDVSVFFSPREKG